MEGETYTLFPKLRKTVIYLYKYNHFKIGKRGREFERNSDWIFFLILHKTIHEKNNYNFK